MKKKLTVGVPVYKAKSTIDKLLASVLFQTMSDDVSVILANDYPDDNGAYSYLVKRYPDLDITILDCEKNTGPGLARQRALDSCKTDWITFMDADDVFMGPFVLEELYNNITPNCIEVQGAFLQEIPEGNLNSAQRMQLI